METMHGALNLLLLQGPEMDVGKFPLSQLFFDGGDQPNITCSQVGNCWGDGPEPGCFAP